MAEKIVFSGDVSVRTLASQLKVEPTQLISRLISNGVVVSINQSIDADTAALIAEQFGFEAEISDGLSTIRKSSSSKTAVTRPPIVTIMGHVDHGKTSLLDYIRRSNVTATESGGITQSISAYRIDFLTKEKERKKITFVDTPGHEAFSALRAHGANLTDVVILVVAADDGVKPQTVEAINHAKKSNVPIVVAINKIDVSGANLERVKQQLAENDLVPEEWGGQTVVVPVSAKTGQGINDLLEMITLTADLLDLKADPEAPSEGIVIEAKLSPQSGPMATVLIYNGTLRTGQVIVVGSTYGRVRALEDDSGQRINFAGPATPIRIFGLKDVPLFGQRIEVVANEKVARALVASSLSGKKATQAKGPTLKLILKVDVGGSLAAFEDSLKKNKFKDAEVELIASGIGQVTENDLALAKTAKATIISFRLPIAKRFQDMALKDEIPLKEYWVIYDAIEYLVTKLKEIATPIFITTVVGRFKVLATFSAKGSEAIIGGEIIDGQFGKNTDFQHLRQKEEIGHGKILAVKVGKVDVDLVEKGNQCGLQVDTQSPIEVGDILVVTETHRE